MNVLVACEFSGTVRDAFIRAGHDAISCDLLPTESPGPHHQGDIIQFLLGRRFDLAITHPDCTYMAVCGNRYHAGTPEREAAIRWTVRLWELLLERCYRVCLENPKSVIAGHLPMKAQYIQPWQFGHPETKETGLWLHNLPPLEATNNVYNYMMTLPKKERHRIWYASPSPYRGKDRSRFYTGIAQAMAEQWG